MSLEYDDILLTDVNEEVLQTAVAEHFGIGYHQKPTAGECEPVTGIVSGYLHGLKRRDDSVRRSGRIQARWVFFIADSGSPMTYLSRQVSAK